MTVAACVAETPTTRLDLMSEATAADPWPSLAELRAQGPVVWHETYRRWLVTSDRAVRRIIVDPGRFTMAGTAIETLFGADAFIAIDDARRHNALRDIWSAAFRQPALERLRPAIRATVDALLAPLRERLRAGEGVDMAAALCRPLPTMVIARMMGVPDAALPDVVRWSDAMAAGGSSYLADADGRAAQAARDDAKDALAAFLRDQLAERRRRPGDDLVSAIVHAEAAQGLPDAQVLQNLRQLLFAGNETTAKWLGHILVTLADRPALQRALAGDRALIPAANDEILRWQGVTGTIVRRVRGGPVEVAGITLADGDDVTCVLAIANRDPARWADPDTLDIHRPPQPNLGFGVGLHNCLGSVLAKIEAEEVVNGLLDALPEFTLALPCRYSTLPLRGPTPVTIARSA